MELHTETSKEKDEEAQIEEATEARPAKKELKSFRKHLRIKVFFKFRVLMFSACSCRYSVVFPGL